MTNRIAIWLALIVLLVLAVDALAFGGGLPVFLGRRLLAILDWLAFWR